jgi:hypothetical protein
LGCVVFTILYFVIVIYIHPFKGCVKDIALLCSLVCVIVFIYILYTVRKWYVPVQFVPVQIIPVSVWVSGVNHSNAENDERPRTKADVEV